MTKLIELNDIHFSYLLIFPHPFSVSSFQKNISVESLFEGIITSFMKDFTRLKTNISITLMTRRKSLFFLDEKAY